MKKHLFLLLLLFCSIVALTQSRYISATTKKIVYARDGGKCTCCGSSVQLEYDHIIPFSCGGRSDRSNIQLLCQKCNRSKSNGCICHIHDRTVGIDCCDGGGSKVNSTKVTPSSKAKQCTGTTQKGTRCKRTTTDPSRRCYQH